MWVTTEPARDFLRRLVFGRAQADAEPRVWARGSAGRQTLRAGCARLAVGYVLRHGGHLAQTVFDEQGARAAHGPLWHAAVRERADWRLSGAALGFVVELLEHAGGGPPPSARPVSAADVLLCHAVADRLDRSAPGSDRPLVAAAAACSPLTGLLWLERDAGDPELAALAPLLDAHWLLPFVLDHWRRRWLAADARRGLLARPVEDRLNARLATVLEHLLAHWLAAERYEHLRLFATLYGGLLARWHGVSGVLHHARRGNWEGWTQAGREAFEAGLGRVFALGPTLVALAGELRALSWERSAAQEAFLGVYSRAYEPHAEAVRVLHRELCRIV